MESALELFGEKGFKGSSISDIAKSAGISKGLAYNYFKDKNELMLSVFDLLSKEMESIFSMTRSEINPKIKLKIFISQTFKQLKNNEKFWRLYMNFALSPEVQYEANRFMGQFVEAALSELEEIFIELNIANPAYESKIFAAILDGVCFHYIFDKDKYPLGGMKRYLIKRYCS